MTDASFPERRGEISVHLVAPDIPEEQRRVLSGVLASTLLSELARLELPIEEADWPQSVVGGGGLSGMRVRLGALRDLD